MEQNGCDFWFDGNWKQCCDLHDTAFQIGGDLGDYFQSNIDLFTCVFQFNPIMAVVMFFGVSVAGWAVFMFKGLKGRTLFEILTKKKYEGRF